MKIMDETLGYIYDITKTDYKIPFKWQGRTYVRSEWVDKRGNRWVRFCGQYYMLDYNNATDKYSMDVETWHGERVR